MVVAEAGGRRPQDVAVCVQRVDDGGQDCQEDGVFRRIAAWIQQVALSVGDAPVVMLAGTVDARERLFMEQADQPVAVRRLPQDFHDQHVVVNGQVQILEDRRQFELRGSHFVMTRFSGNAEAPQRFFNVRHERQNARRDAAEIVVFQLLMLRGRRAVQRTARLQQVRPLQVEFLVNQEIFLFDAQRDLHRLLRLSKAFHQTDNRFFQNLRGAQERRLFVQDFTCVGTENRRDAKRAAVGVPFDEGRACGIPRRVAARLERAAQTARRETGGVRFADSQRLARKLENGLAVREVQEGVMLFGRAARQRLEPVRVVGGATGDGPFLHGRCDFVRDVGIQRLHAVDRRHELLEGRFRQMLGHFFDVEHILRKIIQHLRPLRFRRNGAAVGYLAYCVKSLLHGSVPFLMSSFDLFNCFQMDIGIIAINVPSLSTVPQNADFFL